MKKGIHPKYYTDANFVCASCGTKYDFGSTVESLHVPICAKCHPFYTGEQQVVLDTANKISSFKDRMDKSAELKKKIEDLRKQREERAKSRVGVIGSSTEPRMTLRDLLKENQSGAAKEKKSK